jgi:glycerol-3-phosphate acyltransferase PlsY
MAYSIPRRLRYSFALIGGFFIVELIHSVLLAVSAFWLGACPFSLWVGQWLLGKDIREYGDGNPGAVNVFRAGGRKSGCFALALDVAKGIPLVLLARSFFGFPVAVAMAVGLSAILGHAFSPLLGFRGGKAIAVTFGVLLALPQHEILVMFALFMFLGFLFIESDAWTVMLGPVGSLAYLLTTGATLEEALFMLCALVLFGVKNIRELRTRPRLEGRLLKWLQSRKVEN